MGIQLRHTWYEGIQACKTRVQFKTAMGRQSNAAQQRNSSNAPGTVNSEAVIAAIKPFTSTSGNTSTPMPIVTIVNTSINTLATTPDSRYTEYNAGAAKSKAPTTTIPTPSKMSSPTTTIMHV